MKKDERGKSLDVKVACRDCRGCGLIGLRPVGTGLALITDATWGGEWKKWIFFAAGRLK